MRNWPGVQLCIDPITITGCGTDDDDEFFLLLLLNTLFIHLQLEVSSVVGGGDVLPSQGSCIDEQNYKL